MLYMIDTAKRFFFHKSFANSYARDTIPWDIGRPKPPFLEVADMMADPILDAGCGTGDTSLYFASRGLTVVGIDFVEEAIAKAKAKAAGRDLPVEFMVKDAVKLGEWDLRFNSVIDSGLLHACWDRKQYANGLRHVINPGGRVFVYYFKDDPTSPYGGISDKKLQEIFNEGWEIESIKSVESSEEDLNENFKKEHADEYPRGGWKMKFAIIRKQS